jgi:hypothetical protein
MKKSLESIINVICDLFIFIAILFWFYFLLMLKLIKINPENLSNYFWWSDADVALWNIWNTLSLKFTIIFLIILVLWLGLYSRKFFTEDKNVSEVLSWIVIKSIIMIVIIKCSRFLLWVLVDYTTHLENNQWALIEYSTTSYN